MTTRSEKKRVRERQPLKLITISLVVVATVVSCLSGCNAVKRRLTITSEPSGALVYLNDKEIGRTPISQNFVHSGTYKIRCCKEGFVMEETYYKAGTPWYLYPGFDFISENFVPGEIRDEQHCHVTLTPKREITPEEIKDSAVKLRDEAHNKFHFEQ
ncbi:MAG: PEGA domain-containing protein [Thermoguttaceae bacterium]|nr:PEGA domain-containing protein [Thermoguttaceae bacterium]